MTVEFAKASFCLGSHALCPMPQELREAIIISIHKKYCRAECGNYRGISLLSVVGKIYARIVSKRLRPGVNGCSSDG